MDLFKAKKDLLAKIKLLEELVHIQEKMMRIDERLMENYKAIITDDIKTIKELQNELEKIKNIG